MRNIWISCGYITKAHKVPEKGISPIRFPFGVINFLESHVLRLYTSLSATPAYCERDRIRTYGQQIRNLLLYPTELPIRLRNRRDSNSRPPPWQGGVLTNWTTIPFWAQGWNRTSDLLITNQLLYQLSYSGLYCTQYGIRTRITSVKGRWPNP